jgi:hypothetical protein
MTWTANATDDEDLDVVGDEDDFLPEGAETQEQREDNVRRGFQEDIEEALRLDREKPKDMAARKKYIQDHHHTWSRKMPDQRNFLHFLADQSHQRYCLQWVVAHSVSKLPKLMGELDKDERTPLAIAILRQNTRFIHAVCNNISESNSCIIREALKKECHSINMNNRLTCLQAALSENIDASYILDIINKLAPDEMFRVVDLRGRTPLHLAVDYLKSSDKQIRIVKDLLQKDWRALWIRCLDGRENNLSVYQYHKRTREDHEAKDVRSDAKNQMKPLPRSGLGAGPRDEERNNLAQEIDMLKLDRSLKSTDREESMSDYRASSITTSVSIQSPSLSMCFKEIIIPIYY